MNSQMTSEWNALCNAIRKFRQKHAPEASMTLIMKLQEGMVPKIFKSNADTEPITPNRPRPSQMPLTAYLKRKGSRDNPIEPKQAKPEDESDSAVPSSYSGPGDYANPFDSQEKASEVPNLNYDNPFDDSQPHSGDYENPFDSQEKASQVPDLNYDNPFDDSQPHSDSDSSTLSIADVFTRIEEERDAELNLIDRPERAVHDFDSENAIFIDDSQ